MKLLFDQNLSPKLVARLADLYPASTHVYQVGIDQVNDKELRDYARRHGFVIVTKDSDFQRPLHSARFSAECNLDTSRELQHENHRINLA